MITQPYLSFIANHHQKPFLSQSQFSLQIFNLVVYHIKGEKEVGIPSKDHIFQVSLHTLILFMYEKTSIFLEMYLGNNYELFLKCIFGNSLCSFFQLYLQQ